MTKHARKPYVAHVRVKTPSVKLAETIYQALRPELQASKSVGSQVEIERRGTTMTFHFQADRITVLRALLNSYLRWFITLRRSIEALETETVQ